MHLHLWHYKALRLPKFKFCIKWAWYTKVCHNMLFRVCMCPNLLFCKIFLFCRVGSWVGLNFCQVKIFSSIYNNILLAHSTMHMQAALHGRRLLQRWVTRWRWTKKGRQIRSDCSSLVQAATTTVTASAGGACATNGCPPAAGSWEGRSSGLSDFLSNWRSATFHSWDVARQ